MLAGDFLKHSHYDVDNSDAAGFDKFGREYT